MTKQMATKSIRWTAWILALAALAAVISMWLPDASPASAAHTNRDIHVTVHNPVEGGDGWVQVRTTPHPLFGDLRFDIAMSLANGASSADITSPLVTRRVNVYEDADDPRNQDQGFTISETGGSGSSQKVRSIRFPVTARQDLDFDPNEKIRVAVTNARYDQGCIILPTRKRVCHVAYFAAKNAEVTIVDDEARPSVPGNLRAVTLGPDSVQLTWDASDGGRINGQSQALRNYRYDVDGRFGVIPGGNVTSHIMTGLDTVNNSYTFRIRAESDAGNSWFTGNVTSDMFRPGVPGNFRAVPIGPDSFRLTWEASDAGIVNGQRQTPDYYEYEIRGQRERPKPIPGDATSFVETGLPTFERTYQFRIRAVMDGASSEFTPYWNAGNWRPGTPTNLTATTIGPDSVLLEWEPQDAGVGSDGQPIIPRYEYNFDNILSGVPKAGATSHTVTGLDTVNNAYEFRVRAISEDVPSWFTGYVTSELLPRPGITSVEITSDPGDDGFYLAGEIVEVAVTFSEDIVIFVSPNAEGGLPELELDLGGEPRTAEISGGSGARLVFAYVVQVGDEALNGVAIGANKLTVGDGISIQGEDGVEADLSHDAVPADAGHKVDTVAPTIVSVAITSKPHSGQADVYTVGELIQFTVVFSEEMVFDAAGLLEVEVGGSTWVLLQDLRPSTGTDRVVFTYQVQVGDEDLDGVSVGANSLSVAYETGIIRDAAGHDADLSHDAIPADPNHRVNAPGGL